ncbi:RNA 2',3'-cyclic phosphodiesterase [Soehngenia saccharolytica]|nr:RNA 2',3'-cyclic phosphodiesterase [Soehngenia saccharolytica]
MRLFIAIQFDDNTVHNIYNAVNTLKSHSINGRFVHKEHIHLTLEFLGEIQDEKARVVQQMITNIQFDPFEILINGLGVFNTRHGDIYWLGVKENEALLKLYNDIHNLLKKMNVEVEERTFTPHITLGRNVVIKDRPEELDNINILYRIERVALFKSYNKENRLVHEVIAESKSRV